MKTAYKLQPEWTAQDAIMLTWPHEHGDWAPILASVEQEFLQLAKAIAANERLIISCYDQAHREHVGNLLINNDIDPGTYQIFVIPSNDSWVRDHGPITVLDEYDNPLILDFTFNGWGNKHTADLDNQMSKKLYQQKAFPKAAIKTIDFILEGGSIEVDGNGTLLTTTHCLLNKNRNKLNADEIAQKFQQWFAIKKILWLEHGHLQGDDTDAHIDTLARFVDANTICYIHCDDPSDPHYESMQAMLEQLKSFTNAHNEPYHLAPLPWPKPIYNELNHRLPATYANFLIINNAVFVPNYGDPADKIAEKTLTCLFPNRQVIGISSKAIIQQYGSLHCVTMQLPRGVL